jgi:two-component system phosphate regulon sensor histidine kinase PhoR
MYLGAAVLALIATGTLALFVIQRHEDWGITNPERVIPALFTSILIAISVAMIFCWFLSRSISTSLNQITDVAASLSRGDFNARVKTLQPDEFGLLGLTLNLLGEEITQRIAALSQERAQLRAMLAGLVEGIIAIGDDDRILFCNRAVDKIFNNNVSHAIGKQISDVPGLGILLPIILDTRRSRSRNTCELHLGESESMLSLDTKATYFRGEQVSGVVVVIHDVTDVRRLERIRRDFVANVSHELKTPLTSVKGYVETLIGGAKDDPAVLDRFLRKIGANVDRLEALVHDVLALARAENNDGRIEGEAVDWSAVLKNVLAHHEQHVSAKKLTLECDTANEPVVVFGDKEAMTQIIDNLLSNAIKYTPEGGRVRLTLKKSKSQATLDVEDTGIGIPAAHLPRIFERFYCVDKARSRDMGGTGLGLSIVRHLVQGMSGKISVQSQPGVGSKFCVSLAIDRHTDKSRLVDSLNHQALSPHGETLSRHGEALSRHVERSETSN